MSLTYDIVGLPALAILRAVGIISFEDWEKAMTRVVSDARFQDATPILFDARQLDSVPQPGEAAVAAIRWRALAPRSRGAIVATGDALYNAACQVDMITDGRVRAFRDWDAAVDWLME